MILNVMSSLTPQTPNLWALAASSLVFKRSLHPKTIYMCLLKPSYISPNDVSSTHKFKSLQAHLSSLSLLTFNFFFIFPLGPPLLSLIDPNLFFPAPLIIILNWTIAVISDSYLPPSRFTKHLGSAFKRGHSDYIIPFHKISNSSSLKLDKYPNAWPWPTPLYLS